MGGQSKCVFFIHYVYKLCRGFAAKAFFFFLHTSTDCSAIEKMNISDGLANLKLDNNFRQILKSMLGSNTARVYVDSGEDIV